ncbi:MAG: FISUMP domain-containing protein [Bacteroidales bacterium]|jgi:uncharacterized protein (TIGR02145 family)
MKKTALLFLLVFAIARIQAQNFLITFAGTGSSTTVDSVKVENTSQCTYTSLGGNDILNLTSVLTGINELNTNADNTLHVFPNPMTGLSLINFNAIASGNAIIELYDMAGKRIIQSQDFLSKGNQSYYLSGIGSGIYIIHIKSDEYSYTSKIASNEEANGTPEIKHISQVQGAEIMNNISKTEKIKNVKNSSTIQMQFNAGDTLKLTGKSGNFRTVIMLFPANSQTVTFTFVNCTDADSNHYAVVQIGTQLWMEENLNTIHYNNGDPIPNITDSAAWSNATTGAYCDFHNLPSFSDSFGRLYNWYAVNDPRGIAPAGWHVSTNAEWNVLEVLLDTSIDTTITFGSVGNVIGVKMKENCKTRWERLDTTWASWGDNVSGFTALCSNFRTAIGVWNQAPNSNHDDAFWTATAANSYEAWTRSLRWCYGNIFIASGMETAGSSVRCVKDH